MKKLLLTICAASAVLILPQSCTKKIDEAYPNPNANVVQPIELLMPNIIANLAISFTAQGTNYGPQNDFQYVGRYVQFWATNTIGNQYDQMGQTTTNSTAAAADIGGSHWASLYYGQGQNLNRVIEWGIEQKKWDYVGVAYAIRAWGWICTSDMHGEIIVKQAFDLDRLVFDYDSQEYAYEQAKRDLRTALEYLNRTGDNVSADNLAKGAQYFSYKGDVSKWKKFTYGLLARVYHRFTNKGAAYKADSVAYFCDQALSSNADNAYVLFQGLATSQTNSFFGPFRGNIGTFRQTRFIADLESGVNESFPIADPRAAYIIRENPNGTYRGIRPAKGVEALVAADQPHNFWGGLYSTTTGSNANARYVFKDAMPWPVMTATEMKFIKAEALYRKGEKANALLAYREGIKLSLDMLTETYETSVPDTRKMTQAAKDAFLADIRVVPALANFNLSHIMLQKYIALYGYGVLETWVDMRRYHYIDPEAGTTRQVYTNFEPPATADLFPNNNGKLIYRVRPRYNSEFLYNIDALSKIGALALDYHTKEIWFAQP